MKPVLTVEGKEIEIYALYYRDSKIHSVSVMDEHGVTKTYHDASENMQYYTEKPLQLDFDKAITWQDRYKPVYDALDSFIVSNQTEINGLATTIADAASENTFIPPPKIKQREDLKQRTLGLMDAQDIVHVFMEDDVDLSGGED